MLLIGGCSGKSIQNPLAGLGALKLDRSLPIVKDLKTINSMTEIAIEWKPEIRRGIAGYRIFRSENGSKFRLIKILPDRYSAHFTDTNIRPNSTYVYKVSLFTTDGRVSLTNTTRPVSTKGQVQPPVLVDLISDLPNRIKLLWRIHPNPIVKAYIVERREVGKKSWRKVAILRNRLTVEYIDKDVVPGREYEYRIKAKTYDGIISPPSAPKVGHAKPLPKPIVRISATDNMPKQIQLTWSDPNEGERTIVHYNVYSSAFKDGLYTKLASTKDKSYVDRIDKDGVIRYYQVTAVDSDDLESPKGVVVAKGKTMGNGAGPVITSAVLRHNAIILTWKPPKEPVTSYTIVKKYWDGWRLRKLKIVDFKSSRVPVRFIDKKIKSNTKYTYYVYGVNELGIPTEPSQAISVEVQNLHKQYQP